MRQYDVIVVGSGHAGVEAGYAAARLGCSVLMVTVRWELTAVMSCNPSIGGIGKGHIVREIDVLGGLMGRMADRACIQFKRLNSSKGPAVRGSRAQCDKQIYSSSVRKTLQAHPLISYHSAEVKALILEKGVCKGVLTDKGEKIYALATILSAGTFMRGLLHIGDQKKSGGRDGEKATTGLSDQLKAEGFAVHRLKTGTPPRLKKQSINFSVLKAEKGDSLFRPFSFFSPPTLALPQIFCYLTQTNEKTHNIIHKNLALSALYSGGITGFGPRYCPSVEDKILRFKDKPSHLSFLEPETLKGSSIYPQGLSTSLPAPVQLEFLQSMKGLEKVELIKPGYAVEYDFLDPLQLFPTLETKLFKNLFFAGQINGSSGYEEAAGQGLVAGINASALLKDLPPFVLKRHLAYIGVLIDDLVTKGTKEPYRMLSSRAEHRLLLREDNTVDRLFNLSRQYGLVPLKQLDLLEKELEQRDKLKAFLSKTSILPNEKTKQSLEQLGAPSLSRPQSLKSYMCRPEMSWQTLKKLFPKEITFSDRVLEAVQVEIKYEGYIKREQSFIAQNQKWAHRTLPPLDYDKVKGLSLEALEKLKQVQPQSLGQASRISGVTPSAIQALLIHLKTQPTKPKD